MRAIRSAPLLLWVLLAAPAGAEPAVGEIPLADVLEVLVVDRDVLAIDARGGGQTAARLRLDESVRWKGARGAVGVVITDQRILAAAAGSAAWQEMQYGREETPPEAALLGERVALAVTNVRAVGFDGGSGNLVEYRLGPREQVVGLRVGENVAVVLTDRSALGLSPFVGGFFRAPVDLGDRFESLQAESNLATLTGERRLLVFRATTGTWEERARTLR
jgi:hypothetical protein